MFFKIESMTATFANTMVFMFMLFLFVLVFFYPHQAGRLFAEMANGFREIFKR